MFNKVMWATDGSEAADQALPYARSLVTDSGGQLFVVHIDEWTMPGKAGGALEIHANEGELKTKVQRQVDDLTREGISASLQTSTTRVGGAAHVIADAAAQVGAEAIVVGTRGHTPIGGLLVGSVTQRLLHVAPCPVLVVPARRDPASSTSRV